MYKRLNYRKIFPQCTDLLLFPIPSHRSHIWSVVRQAFRGTAGRQHRTEMSTLPHVIHHACTDWRKDTSWKRRCVKDIPGKIGTKKVLLYFCHGRQSSQAIIIPFSAAGRVHYSSGEAGDAGGGTEMHYPSLHQRCTCRSFHILVL